MSRRSWKNVNLFGATNEMRILATKMHKILLVVLLCFCVANAQTKSGSHSTRKPASMSAEAKALVEEAIGVVCTQGKLDPQSSMPIDEMQARPSLPVHSPEARAGAERAQRLLPLAKTLVSASLRRLTTDYGLHKSQRFTVLHSFPTRRSSDLKSVV